MYNNNDNKNKVYVRDSKIVCTFVDYNQIDSTLKFIQQHIKTKFNKLVVLQQVGFVEQSKLKYFIVYQTDANVMQDIHVVKNSIAMHRKNQYNVLFTINGLNQLIRKEEGFDGNMNYPVDWEKYSKKIIYHQNDTLAMHSTRIYKVHKILTQQVIKNHYNG